MNARVARAHPWACDLCNSCMLAPGAGVCGRVLPLQLVLRIRHHRPRVGRCGEYRYGLALGLLERPVAMAYRHRRVLPVSLLVTG